MKIIIIDGLDAVGKDTHAELIAKRYEAMGKKVIIRSHPEIDNYYGKKAKNALLGYGKLNKLQASFFYMLDVLRSIKKYYGNQDYDILIMVRYLMGTAYLPSKLAKVGYNLFEGFVPTSEYMFFLDAPPDVLRKRVEEREEKEIFETIGELLKVRNKALSLAEKWHIIDTTCSVNETYDQIEKILNYLDERYS